MAKRITWVGIDDHKKELVAAVVRGRGQKTPEVASIANEDGALRRWVRKLVREAEGGEVRMCYEAGPNGFALKRRLEAQGPVTVEVIAPSLTPRRSGQRVKTDRIDARKLVLLYRAGELRTVAVPGTGEEAARDLVRLYHAVVTEATRKRHQIQKFLVRRGRIYGPGQNWTRQYREWLVAQQWEDWRDEQVFEELRSGLQELETRKARLKTVMDRMAADAERALLVGVLRCFQGIDTVAAMTLATELFAIGRFRHPRDLMSYLGLTPAIHQSADQAWRGGITKTGNRLCRWVLGEAAWHYRRRPQVGRGLAKRRQGQPVWAIAIADRAHQRLYRRYARLVAAGKPTHKAATAVARELAGFLWEAWTQVASRTQHQQPAAA